MPKHYANKRLTKLDPIFNEIDSLDETTSTNVRPTSQGTQENTNATGARPAVDD